MVRGVPVWKIREAKVAELLERVDLLVKAKQNVTNLEIEILMLSDKLTEGEQAEIHRRYWQNGMKSFDPKYSLFLRLKNHGPGNR